MNRLLVSAVVLLGALPALALPAELKAEAERLAANAKAEMDSYQKLVKQVVERMKASHTQTPTKEDDSAVLSAMKSQNTALQAIYDFDVAHAEELKADNPNFDTKLSEVKTTLDAMKQLAALAETEGAMKVIARFGENLRKEIDKKAGKVALSAKSDWTDTLFKVKTGDVVHIEVTGSWTVSPKYALFDADGMANTGGFFDYRVYKGANLGAAICRVGKSDKIYGGKSMRFMADMDGSVECRVNDTDLGNNVGEVRVEFVAGK